MPFRRKLVPVSILIAAGALLMAGPGHAVERAAAGALPATVRHPQRIRQQLRSVGRETLPVTHFTHRATRTAKGAGDLVQAPALRQSPSDLLVAMHRHAPKRHAVLSFVAAHEGCDRLGQKIGDSGSRPQKHRFHPQHPKIDRVGSPHSRNRVPPLASGTPKKHALTLNRDIDGPLPRLRSAP